jgi:hypothetical protein
LMDSCQLAALLSSAAHVERLVAQLIIHPHHSPPGCFVFTCAAAPRSGAVVDINGLFHSPFV